MTTKNARLDVLTVPTFDGDGYTSTAVSASGERYTVEWQPLESFDGADPRNACDWAVFSVYDRSDNTVGDERCFALTFCF